MARSSFRSLVSAVSEQFQEIKEALSLFPYFDTWDEKSIAELCRIATIQQYPPDSVILGSESGKSHMVYFVLEGICTMIHYLQILESKKPFKKPTYKLYYPDESDSNISENKSIKYSSIMFNEKINWEAIQFEEEPEAPGTPKAESGDEKMNAHSGEEKFEDGNMEGKGSSSCPDCNVPLRRSNFKIQLFEDAGVEKEVDFRKRVSKDFNKKEEDFATLDEYNDYVEEVETIIYNSTNNIDVIETNKKIEQYKRENKDVILENKTKIGKEEYELKEILEEEKMQEEARKKLLAQEEKEKGDLTTEADKTEDPEKPDQDFETEPKETPPAESEHQDPVSERSEPISEPPDPISERSEPISEPPDPISERSEPQESVPESVSDSQEPGLEREESMTEVEEPESKPKEAVPKPEKPIPEPQEPIPEPEPTPEPEEVEEKKPTYGPDHHLLVLAECINRRLQATKKTSELLDVSRPENLKRIFVRTAFLSKGATFGLEQEEKDSFIISSTNVKCLRIPKRFLLQHDPYSTSIWDRIKLFQRLHYPKNDKVLEKVKQEWEWIKYKKELTQRIILKQKIPNYTSIADVPLAFRLGKVPGV